MVIQRRDNTSDNHVYKTLYNEKIPVNNSMVVPYNKFLLMKYKCHINVELCASIQSIKYIFKYIHKSSDRAFVQIQKNDNCNEDEIKNYVDGRYLSAMESALRLQNYPICYRSHAVKNLPVHDKNKEYKIFEENKIKTALENYETRLTAWFELNKVNNS